MSKYKKFFCMFLILLLAVCLLSTTAFAAGTGDVAGAIEGTWNDASDQIKTVVNNVVFPVIDLILAVFFFAKLGMAYFDYDSGSGNPAGKSSFARHHPAYLRGKPHRGT